MMEDSKKNEDLNEALKTGEQSVAEIAGKNEAAGQTGEEVLRMRSIRKRFDDLEVLKNISLTVHHGEVVSIIGPSGSGKSTLLRCATFLEKIDSGEIVYLGRKAAGTNHHGKVFYTSKAEMKDIKRYFGLVFQQFNLFPHLSVLKNVMDAPVSVLKRDKKEVETEARVLLEKMGLADKADQYPCNLSGGQQQRVAIARALAMKPEVLFFDEPIDRKSVV